MTSTDPDDVYATCTTAADLIESNGWVQGDFWRHPTTGAMIEEYVPGAPVCALGAIRAASGLIRMEDSNTYNGGMAASWEECRATRAVEREVRGRLETNKAQLAPISYWNDLRGRAAADVVSLLRDVAAKHMPDEFRSGPEVTS